MVSGDYRPERHSAGTAVVPARTVLVGRPCVYLPIVNKTRRYTVLIVRGRTGHVAFAPKLPEVVGRGRGRNRAYKDFKARLQQHVLALIERGVPLPDEDIVSVKYVRVDIRALESRITLT